MLVLELGLAGLLTLLDYQTESQDIGDIFVKAEAVAIYAGQKLTNINENITKNAKVIATKPIVKPIFLNKLIGSMGYSVLFSHLMKAKVRTKPNPAVPIVSRLVHPELGASIIAYSKDKRALTDKIEPTKSNGRS